MEGYTHTCRILCTPEYKRKKIYRWDLLFQSAFGDKTSPPFAGLFYSKCLFTFFLSYRIPSIIFHFSSLVVVLFHFSCLFLLFIVCCVISLPILPQFKAYGKRTFLITTLKPVPPGTEGAVSLEGTAAGVGGSLIIAAFAAATGVIATQVAMWNEFSRNFMPLWDLLLYETCILWWFQIWEFNFWGECNRVYVKFVGNHNLFVIFKFRWQLKFVGFDLVEVSKQFSRVCVYERIGNCVLLSSHNDACSSDDFDPLITGGAAFCLLLSRDITYARWRDDGYTSCTSE